MKEIYPDITIDEIISKAKTDVVRYPKKYKKGDFIYLYEKRLFKETAIGAIHIPTRKIFAYGNYTGLWNEITTDVTTDEVEALIK